MGCVFVRFTCSSCAEGPSNRLRPSCPCCLRVFIQDRVVQGARWTCPIFVRRWARWRWTGSLSLSASRCSASSSLRQWRRWICQCPAASAWGATATWEPSRRAAPRTMSASRCGPRLPRVRPLRWGPSRAVLVSNKTDVQRDGRKGRYLSVWLHQVSHEISARHKAHERVCVSAGSWTD